MVESQTSKSPGILILAAFKIQKSLKKNKDESSVCVGVNPGNPGNDCVITELPRTRTLTIQSV